MARQAPAPYSIDVPVAQQPTAPYATTPSPPSQQRPPPLVPADPPPLRPGAPVIGECFACGTGIKEGEEVLEVFPGIAGISGQSGQLLAEPYPNEAAKSYTVHRKCAMEVLGELYPDDADEMFYEMASEMAWEQVEEFLRDRGIHSVDDLEQLLDRMGYTSEDEKLQRRVQEDE